MKQTVEKKTEGSCFGIGHPANLKARREALGQTRRIVVKVGSAVLAGKKGLDPQAVSGLAGDVARLMKTGREVIVVTSGAIAEGMRKMGIEARPTEIPEKQAVAAVGQAGLMREYEKAFFARKIKVAQILLTRDDLTNRRRYLNARNTLQTLLSWGVAPIVNENDTVVVDELKFGENDNLSAMVTHLMDADLLVILTDTDGLYTKNPREYADCSLISTVAAIGKDVLSLASGGAGDMGTGGMASKLAAARKVTAAGIPVVVANGKKPAILKSLFSGKEEGTFFMPGPKKIGGRKCWIAFALKPSGALFLDRGAVEAVLRGGKSLLPVGVCGVRGDFGEGSAVECGSQNGPVIAVGLVNYNSAQIRRIMGRPTREIVKLLGHKPYDEVIHRDNLVLT